MSCLSSLAYKMRSTAAVRRLTLCDFGTCAQLEKTESGVITLPSNDAEYGTEKHVRAILESETEQPCTFFTTACSDDKLRLYRPRDAQRDCCKKAIMYESAPQAISALSLSWLSVSWTFRFIAENTNATRKDLEPLHLRGTSRGASRGKSPSLVLRRSECFLHRSLPSLKRRVRYAHLTGSAVPLLTPPEWSALPPPRL